MQPQSEVATSLEAKITRLKEELDQLTVACKAKKVELRQHKKALKAISNSGQHQAKLPLETENG